MHTDNDDEEEADMGGEEGMKRERERDRDEGKESKNKSLRQSFIMARKQSGTCSLLSQRKTALDMAGYATLYYTTLCYATLCYAMI